jgi:hypothetical protein
VSKHEPYATVLDGRGPAASLTADLENAGVVVTELERVGAR